VKARLRRLPLALDPTPYPDVKDPCPVLVAGTWHLFATGCRALGGWDVLHAVAAAPGGPWRLLAPSRVDGVHGTGVCAPGVTVEGDVLHLWLQTDFAAPGARVEHCVSSDGGATFVRVGTAVAPTPPSGAYDGQPAWVHGRRWLAWAQFDTVGRTELWAAAADGWDGPWAGAAPLLRLTDVGWQARPGSPSYEWGLEGPQLLELLDGRVLLVAVGFRRRGRSGTRQRLLLAVAPAVEGPWEVLPPPLHGPGAWGGENGHGTGYLVDGRVELLLQERRAGGHWGLARALLTIS